MQSCILSKLRRRRVSIKYTNTLNILMATYNGEKYIAEQIESILTQTYTNFRLIISDDNSTDSTKDIIEKYSSTDNRIIFNSNKTNIGVIKNFEKLINNSRSEYFMLCDQDDVWYPNKVEKSLEFIMNNDVLLMYSDLHVVNDQLQTISQSYWRMKKISPVKRKPWTTLLVQNVVTGCTIIAKNELKHFALPFPNIIEMHDSWLALVASIHGEINYIDEPMILYRQHQNNYVGASSSNEMYDAISYKEFYEKRIKYLVNKEKIYASYIESLADSDVSNDIKKLLNLYRKSIRIKYFNTSLLMTRTKLEFKSKGMLRNIWWISFLQFPVLSYILIKIKQKNNDL